MRFASIVFVLAMAGVSWTQQPIAVDAPLPEILPPQVMSQESIIDFAPKVGCSHYAGIDAILGLPTGIRAQFGVLHREKYTLAIDGLVGALATRHDIPAVAGVGPRIIWNYFSDSHANAFQINPGCYFLGTTQTTRRNGGLLIAPTVDFIWIHDFYRHAAFHGGVELGTGYDSRGDWFPVVAVFAGLRF